MPRTRAHSLLLPYHRPRLWAVIAAAVVLAAWLFEFSTHFHFDEDTKAPPHSSHYCGVCAALQAGAGSPVVSFFFPRVAPVFAGTYVLLPPPRPALHLPYRSRAPPARESSRRNA